MRLGVYTDRSAFCQADKTYMSVADGRLMTALRNRCGELTVALSAAPEQTPTYCYDLSPYDIRVIKGPYVSSIARGFCRLRTARRVIRQLEQISDVVLVQLPVAAVTALFQPKKPRVYQVCANVRTIVADSPYYTGPKRWAATGLSRYIDHCQHRLIHHPNARLVAHGPELLTHYGADRGRAVVSSSLLPADILSVPRSRPADAPFRILFVGYFRHEKGIDVLLDAFERLIPLIPNIELEIVGAKDLSDHGIADHLRQTIERLGPAVKLRGHAGFGPELFQLYADADVCVVPSRSEGTPRVLIEARALGCPVVATRIGGIPASIDDGHDGLLCPPGDVASLAAAIARIAQDGTLRNRLIQAGIERARRTTVDDFADAIMGEANAAWELTTSCIRTTN